MNTYHIRNKATIPLLHNAAHGVNSTVAEVSPQHLPHQLRTQRAAQHEKRSNNKKMEEALINTAKQKANVCACACSSLTFQQDSQNSLTLTVRQSVMMKTVRESEGRQL